MHWVSFRMTTSLLVSNSINTVKVSDRACKSSPELYRWLYQFSVIYLIANWYSHLWECIKIHQRTIYLVFLWHNTIRMFQSTLKSSHFFFVQKIPVPMNSKLFCQDNLFFILPTSRGITIITYKINVWN